MCDRGHAYFRQYESGCWYLACCQCPDRILEGRAVTGPPFTEIELPRPVPETEQAA